MKTAQLALLGAGIALIAGGLVGWGIASANSAALSGRFVSECTAVPGGANCFAILNEIAYWGLINLLAWTALGIGVLLAIIGAILSVIQESPTPAYAAPAPMYVPPAPPPVPLVCRSCGAALPPGWGFCGRCGAKQ